MKYGKDTAPAKQITEVFHRLYERGLTSTSGGNVSIRDDDGYVWITPSSTDKGMLLESEIVRIAPDGSISGKYSPSIEHRFHNAVYNVRQDVQAVLHAHSPVLVAYAAARTAPQLAMLPQIYYTCRDACVIPYHEPGTPELSASVRAAFDENERTCAILANHGAMTAADTLWNAFVKFEQLDRAGRIELYARAIAGAPKLIPDRHLAMYRLKATPVAEDFVPDPPDYEEDNARESLASFVRRAYRLGLTSSSEGAFSCRLSDDEFLITPYNEDRATMKPEMLVKIKNGRAERGKVPSHSMTFHKLVYDHCKEWNALIIAEPEYLMAYAVTGEAYEERYMSESQHLIHGIPKLPFGSTVMQPKLTASELSERMPVSIVENDCAIAGGPTLLSAYNRLEIAEYGAKSLVQAKLLGEKLYKI